MISSLPRPVIFAHRGASGQAPENTIPAFQLAIEQGAAAIEFDVQLSKDGSIVVFHNPAVDQITNGKGKIQDLTLAQIKDLSFVSTRDSIDIQVGIPTLEEVLATLPSSVLINIELKNLTTPFDDLPEKVSHLVKTRAIENQLLVSSFNFYALRKLHRRSPAIPLGQLIHSAFSAEFCLLFPSLLQHCLSVHLSLDIINKRRIAAFHNLGKLVFCYTCNQIGEMKWALWVGVDGFFTDYPDLAQKAFVIGQGVGADQ